MKYLTLWEMDMSRIPTDPQQSGAVMMKMIEMTKQWLKDNPGAEWGSFIGEHKGFVLGGRTPQDIMKTTMMFSPYIKFKVYQAASADEVEENIKSMMPKK
jgi:hypothetical protein